MAFWSSDFDSSPSYFGVFLFTVKDWTAFEVFGRTDRPRDGVRRPVRTPGRYLGWSFTGKTRHIAQTLCTIPMGSKCQAEEISLFILFTGSHQAKLVVYQENCDGTTSN